MKKIFVGNLAWKATEDTLKSLFEQFGEVVSVKIVTDQYTGKSRGFGFVEMKNDEDAQKAIRELDDKPYMERNLRVSLAQERSDQQRSGGDRNNGQGGRGGWGGGDRERSGRGGSRSGGDHGGFNR